MSHGGLAIRVDLQIEAPGGSAGVPVTSLPVPDGQEDDAVPRATLDVRIGGSDPPAVVVDWGDLPSSQEADRGARRLGAQGVPGGSARRREWQPRGACWLTNGDAPGPTGRGPGPRRTRPGRPRPSSRRTPGSRRRRSPLPLSGRRHGGGPATARPGRSRWSDICSSSLGFIRTDRAASVRSMASRLRPASASPAPTSSRALANAASPGTARIASSSATDRAMSAASNRLSPCSASSSPRQQASVTAAAISSVTRTGSSTSPSDQASAEARRTARLVRCLSVVAMALAEPSTCSACRHRPR